MTALTRLLPGRLGRGYLVAATALIALGLIAALSWRLTGEARTVALVRLDKIAELLVDKLATDGIAQTAAMADQLASTQPAGEGQLVVVLWRQVGGSPQWMAGPGGSQAEFLAGIPVGPARRHATPDGPIMIAAPDVASLSADWIAPISNVGLRVAFIGSTPEEFAASEFVLYMLGGFAAGMGLIGLLAFQRAQRYRRDVADMSAVLSRFADDDMTARMHPLPALPDLADLARHLNGVLGRLEEFIGTLRNSSSHVAHELAQPLQAMRRSVDRMRRGEMDGQFSALDRLIDDLDQRRRSLMKFFQLEAGEGASLRAGVDLGEIVRNALDDAMDSLETQNRTIEEDIGDGIIVTADSHLADMMVSNLLTNAAKYAPEAATITVRLVRDGGGFRLTVANTGATFAADIESRAFLRYARARNATSKPGAGLGLALVGAIARTHGFTAEIVPAKDRAEVCISGPLDRPAPEERSLPA